MFYIDLSTQKIGSSIPFYLTKLSSSHKYHNNKLTRFVFLNSFILKVAEHDLETVGIC